MIKTTPIRPSNNSSVSPQTISDSKHIEAREIDGAPNANQNPGLNSREFPHVKPPDGSLPSNAPSSSKQDDGRISPTGDRNVTGVVQGIPVKFNEFVNSIKLAFIG